MALYAIHFSAMTYQEFARIFKLKTETLLYPEQIDLAVSICKRLYFDYQKFSDKNSWGNAELLLDTIKFIEEFKITKSDKILVEEKISKIGEITPDTEDFADSSYALNACVAICETLDFLIDHKGEHIYNVGTCLTDTIDFKIQEDGNLKQHEIDSNKEMIAARTFLLGVNR
jgi:uncharacterized protein YjaG (DUF416 family)